MRGQLAAGDLAERAGDHATASAWSEAARALAVEIGDHANTAAALRHLGNIAISREDLALAAAYLNQSIPLSWQAADAWGLAQAANWLGVVACLEGAFETGVRQLTESLTSFRELGDHRYIATVLINLAVALNDLGIVERARTAALEALNLSRRLGYRWLIALCLLVLGEVALARDGPEQATTLLAAATALRDVTGEPLRHKMQIDHDRVISRAHDLLGDDAFDTIWATGRSLSLVQTLAVATTEQPEAVIFPRDSGSRVAVRGHLTRREQDVLRLLAEGLSNKEIAQRLNIAPRTAARHVANILAALCLDSDRGGLRRD